MPKYISEVTKHFSGDKTLAARYMGVARGLLGSLVDMSGDVFQNARKVILPDGTKITVSFAGALARIAIDVVATAIQIASKFQKTYLFVASGVDGKVRLFHKDSLELHGTYNVDMPSRYWTSDVYKYPYVSMTYLQGTGPDEFRPDTGSTIRHITAMSHSLFRYCQYILAYSDVQVTAPFIANSELTTRMVYASPDTPEQAPYSPEIHNGLFTGFNPTSNVFQYNKGDVLDTAVGAIMLRDSYTHPRAQSFDAINPLLTYPYPTVQYPDAIANRYDFLRVLAYGGAPRDGYDYYTVGDLIPAFNDPSKIDMPFLVASQLVEVSSFIEIVPPIIPGHLDALYSAKGYVYDTAWKINKSGTRASRIAFCGSAYGYYMNRNIPLSDKDYTHSTIIHVDFSGTNKSPIVTFDVEYLPGNVIAIDYRDDEFVTVSGPDSNGWASNVYPSQYTSSDGWLDQANITIPSTYSHHILDINIASHTAIYITPDGSIRMLRGNNIVAIPNNPSCPYLGQWYNDGPALVGSRKSPHHAAWDAGHGFNPMFVDIPNGVLVFTPADMCTSTMSKIWLYRDNNGTLIDVTNHLVPNSNSLSAPSLIGISTNAHSLYTSWVSYGYVDELWAIENESIKE